LCRFRARRADRERPAKTVREIEAEAVAFVVSCGFQPEGLTESRRGQAERRPRIAVPPPIDSTLNGSHKHLPVRTTVR